MAATAYGHATFFLLAQNHAGQARASAISDNIIDKSPQSAVRDPAKIASDRAAVQRDLAGIDSQHCRDNCNRLRYRRVVAAARLDALNVEMAQSERQQRLEDAVDAERAQVSATRAVAASDPVTIRLAHLIGVDVGTINLWLAIALGLLVEGLGSFSWLIALADTAPPAHAPNPGAVVIRSRADGNVTLEEASGEACCSSITPLVLRGVEDAESNERVTSADITRAPTSNVAVAVIDVTEVLSSNDASNDDAWHTGGTLPSGPTDNAPTEDPSTEGVSADLSRLHAGIESGDVRATVASIRKYFRCSQKRAMLINREYAKRKVS
jgi:hypothetical protein